MLSEKKALFLENLEPTLISHILLEEEAFSVDDHDAVNNKGHRREKTEALLDILKNDGSELTFETFIFALSDDKFILNNLQPGAEVQSKINASISILQNLLYISYCISVLFSYIFYISIFVLIHVPCISAHLKRNVKFKQNHFAKIINIVIRVPYMHV